MKTIGGMFPMEAALPRENGFFERICPPGGEVRFAMSGRCGLYDCLMDAAETDARKVAYVPVYTCETVLGSFDKAGYQLRFYDVDEHLRSIFKAEVLDEISVISLCGYYGYCNYDRDFVVECKKRGIVVLEDVTHSELSADGIDPLCDYVAGSFRKWMGVPCGGFAMKCSGRFAKPLLPVDPTHLSLRQKVIATADSDDFWAGEMLLRRMFDRFDGDAQSETILRHADLQMISQRRRRNVAAILKDLRSDPDGIRPVFPTLTESVVPSHFVLYASDREDFRAYMTGRGIRSTVYWPVPPQVDLNGHDTARYIYDHIVAVPCDQRYDESDMARIAQALNEYAPETRR